MKKPVQQPIVEKNKFVSTPFQRLVLHSAVAAALVGGGYGRAAYAGSCTPGPVSTCSGPANDGTDVTQNVSGTALTVTTTAGFGIDTTSTGGSGLNLQAADGLSFTDANNSIITGNYRGIEASNFGSGALSITSNATVTGQTGGILALNFASGALSITSTGAVKGTNYIGIGARNEGTNLTLQTAAVTGAWGIAAINYSGTLNITSSGEVTGTNLYGISAYQLGTDLTLQTAAVTGGRAGILARNHGSGALSITTSDAVTGTDGPGIVAINYGTDLTLETEGVTGEYTGIYATNAGSGALSITTSGAVTGSDGAGIVAYNAGTDMTLQTAAVTGGYAGIYVENGGSGALSITTSGAVTGTDGSGIVAYNYGTDLTLQTAAVTGGFAGISVVHSGSGALSITTDGIVTGGTGAALQLDSNNVGSTNGTITNNGGLVSNQAAAVLMTSGLNFEGDFNNNADITGGNGIAFDASATNNGIVLNQAAGTITGNVLLGSGDDRVTINGGSINGQIIGQGFGVVNIDVGAGNNFNGNGVVDVADYVIQSGTVHQLADFSTAATTTTVASGATLSFSSVIHGGGALVSNGDLAFVLSPGSTGELIQAGTVTLNGGSTITLVSNGFSPTLNQSFQLISATSIVDNGVVLDEGTAGSLLYDFDALITGNSLAVVTTVADLGAVSPLQNPSAFGNSMTAFVNGGGNNAVVDLLAGLDNGDVAGFEQIADVFSPSVSGAVSQGAREANDSTWRLINERFVGSEAALHISEPPNGVWLQGYGGTTDQDGINGVDGFEADTSGVALGYDLDLGQWRVGAAFSAGETDIDNDRFASDSIDIESNQFIVYGGFWQDQWFANATASAASLDYDFKRNNMIAGEGPIKSNTDGDLLGMSVSGGYQYTVSDNIVVTPQLSLRYTTLDVDDYTENGGLGLRVAYDSIDTLASELGVSASTHYAAGDWQWAPTARLVWVHEYLGDSEHATARYADQSYIQEGFDPDENFASVGLGIEASNAFGVAVSIDYRGTFGSDYTSNQGWLNVRYEF